MQSLIALMFATHAAGAFASERDPLNYPLKQWGLILFFSLLGGFVSWYRKVQRGELAATNLFTLIGEFTTSALAGLLAFMICDYFSVPVGLTAAVAGLAGHAGAKGLTIAEALLQRAAERKLGIAPSDTQIPDKD